jgi:hypothetical protein
MDPQEYKRSSMPSAFGPRGYEPVPLVEQNTAYNGARPYNDDVHLMADAASIGGRSASHGRSISGERSVSPPNTRAPRLPSVDLGSHQAGYTQQSGPWQPQGNYRGQAY